MRPLSHLYAKRRLGSAGCVTGSLLACGWGRASSMSCLLKWLLFLLAAEDTGRNPTSIPLAGTLRARLRLSWLALHGVKLLTIRIKNQEHN
jgi:hypothetical protein